MNVNDKILNSLLDSFTVDEFESLLVKKKSTIKKPAPKAMTETEKWTRHYENEVIKLGVLYPPK